MFYAISYTPVSRTGKPYPTVVLSDQSAEQIATTLGYLAHVNQPGEWFVEAALIQDMDGSNPVTLMHYEFQANSDAVLR